jgi:hypothetical protein
MIARARSLAAAERIEDSISAIEGLPDLKDADLAYVAAGVLARCGQVAGKKAGKQQGDDVVRYLDQALQLLETARVIGKFTDKSAIDQLKSDPDFDALRDHAPFQQWLERLAAE